MKIATSIGVCIFMAGCAVPSKPKEPDATVVKRLSLTAAQISVIQKGVAEGMKDPESARFGHIDANQMSDGTIVACGWVNGKNSYGGYIGMKPFHGIALTDLKVFRPISYGGTEIDTSITLTMCERAGIYT